MNDTAVADLLKWLLIGCAAGYPFLGGFIMFLVKELLKSKDQQVNIMQEATLYNRETIDTLDRVVEVVDKVAELLT